jgi:hypothetical protein
MLASGGTASEPSCIEKNHHAATAGGGGNAVAIWTMGCQGLDHKVASWPNRSRPVNHGAMAHVIAFSSLLFILHCMRRRMMYVLRTGKSRPGIEVVRTYIPRLVEGGRVESCRSKNEGCLRDSPPSGEGAGWWWVRRLVRRACYGERRAGGVPLHPSRLPSFYRSISSCRLSAFCIIPPIWPLQRL